MTYGCRYDLMGPYMISDIKHRSRMLITHILCAYYIICHRDCIISIFGKTTVAALYVW